MLSRNGYANTTQGRKGVLDPGEVLYNANEVEPHLALELTERLIRLALESVNDDLPEGDEELELDENGRERSRTPEVQLPLVLFLLLLSLLLLLQLHNHRSSLSGAAFLGGLGDGEH